MNFGNIAGIALGIKLVNGRFKPKFGAKAIVAVTIQLLFCIGFLAASIYGIVTFNLEFIAMGSLGVFGFGYLLLISPHTQRSKNYYIEFVSENSLAGFKLIYKNKPVSILYKVDSKGKIAFANNNSKLSCISYTDGSKMGNFTKYKIINYFAEWLNDNGLISDEVTTSLEEL